MSIKRSSKILRLSNFKILACSLSSKPYAVQTINNWFFKKPCITSCYSAIKNFSDCCPPPPKCCPPPPKCCNPNDDPVACYSEVKKFASCPTKCIYLIDVRTKCEIVSKGKIPNSINIPANELCSAFEMCPDDFKCKYGVKKPDKKKELIFYSNSCKRSGKAMSIAKRLCFKYPRQYMGGYNEWKKKQCSSC